MHPAERDRAAIQGPHHLVSNLVNDSKKKPEKLRAVKEREKQASKTREAIKSAVTSLHEGNQVISSA